MTSQDAFDILRSAMWLVIAASSPIVIAVMVVGLVVSLFQALTQVQEMTLTFVPKMLVAMTMLVFAGPYIGNSVQAFAEQAYAMIGHTGGDAKTPATRVGRR